MGCGAIARCRATSGGHELVALARAGRQAEMGQLIDDEILDAFGSSRRWSRSRISATAARRQHSFNVDFGRDVERWGTMLEQLRAIPGGRARAGSA